MDFFIKLQIVLVITSFISFVLTMVVGVEADMTGRDWACLWWPRFLKIGTGCLVLAAIIFLFN